MKEPDLQYTPECYRDTLRFIVDDMSRGGILWQNAIFNQRFFMNQVFLYALMCVDVVNALRVIGEKTTKDTVEEFKRALYEAQGIKLDE